MDVDTADILEESLHIASPSGSLPAVLAYPFAGTPCGAVLVAGPHPLMGDSLQNNVVRAVARGMAEHGFVSLRFAYGGAGPTIESMHDFWQTGHAPDDPIRIDDAQAALEQLQRICSQPILLIGYSFGAWVISDLLSRSTPRKLVLIGPTLRQHSNAAVQQSNVPKLIIMGNNDFATPIEFVRDWFEIVREPKKLVVIDAAEHFYRGQEEQLVEEIVQWI